MSAPIQFGAPSLLHQKPAYHFLYENSYWLFRSQIPAKLAATSLAICSWLKEMVAYLFLMAVDVVLNIVFPQTLTLSWIEVWIKSDSFLHIQSLLSDSDFIDDKTLKPSIKGSSILFFWTSTSYLID